MLRIREYRVARKPKLTQEDLAERVGVDKGSMSRYERGLRWPAPATLEAIAQVLQVDVADLFPSFDNPTPDEREIAALLRSIPPARRDAAADAVKRVLAAMRTDLEQP